MSRGVDRIMSILSASRKSKEVAAVLVPKPFALNLVDELFPMPPHREPWGVAKMDESDAWYRGKKERERDRYLSAVGGGGYVGMVFGVPMLVADDCVVCTFDRSELEEHAVLHGVDLSELP